MLVSPSDFQLEDQWFGCQGQVISALLCFFAPHGL